METLDDLLKWNMRGLAFVNWCNAIGTTAGEAAGGIGDVQMKPVIMWAALTARGNVLQTAYPRKDAIAMTEAATGESWRELRRAYKCRVAKLEAVAEAAQVDLDLLRRAISEGDPKAELLIRVDDIKQRMRAALDGEKADD